MNTEMERDEYIRLVLSLYLGLPETPARSNRPDWLRAGQLHERGVPLPVIESALLLASVRRLSRPADYPALSPIRSLAYFWPIIEEVMENPLPDGYVEYLREKLRVFRGSVITVKAPDVGGCSEKYVSS